jgi:hypothetical protein
MESAVHEAVPDALAAWESFYVILGSSAAALTGLMFVVIVLIADTGARTAGPAGIGAFATPTIVHFSAALMVSAILSAPWQQLTTVVWPLGIGGAACALYTLVVIRRALHVRGYQPVFEDWACHVILPFAGYAAIVVAALTLRLHTHTALFIVGGATVLLVFVGIHNAWDTVTHMTIQYLQREQEGKKEH